MSPPYAAGAQPMIFAAEPCAGIDELEPRLFEAFTAIRAALLDGRPVVVVVSQADLLGHGTPADAALAGGLLGLTRALATEGVRYGWRINALALGDDIPAEELASWSLQLAESSTINGEVINLGNLHLGKVSV